ncbi:hypothetical protein DMI69_12325 [Escherichia coli]|nr:hypothetical protein [Escherichia coli]
MTHIVRFIGLLLLNASLCAVDE